MKGNEISVNELTPDAVQWLAKLPQTMRVKDYWQRWHGLLAKPGSGKWIQNTLGKIERV